MNVKRIQSLFPILLVVLAIMVVLWPLIRPGFYISDDGEWMIIRLSAFYQSLRDHQFPVRFLGRLNNSYGYPVANFLYPGFLYIGSLLHYIGFTFVDSVKIMLGGSVIGTAVILYLGLRREFSRFSSSVGVLAFICAPYLLFDLYKRGSVGEILAFFPASLGIYSIESGKKWLFPISIAFLIVSHNTLALLFVLVLLVFILVKTKFEYLWLLALGIVMATFFWLPALMEKKLIRFDMVLVSDPFAYFLTLQNFWLVGLSGIVACFLILLKFRRLSIKNSVGIYLFFFLISMWLASPFSRSLWEIPTFATLVQFPFRFLAVGTLMTPWVVASVSEKFVNQKVLFSVVLIFILAIPVWSALNNISYTHRDEGYYTTNEGTTTVMNEYMPRWVSRIQNSRSSERLIISSGRGRIVYEYLNTQRIIAHIETSEESVVRLNTIYYPGWGIMINNVPTKISYQNPDGFIEVSVPVGSHRFIAEFRETVPRFLADFVSFVGALVYIVYLFKTYRR
ncbi:MAG: hypothetical protein Q8L37_00875 [Candidatus Gottesmanbacteria bacterium]|nr:hypothetical protein [Candidatus Gottesmanbacteria bacterium]